MACIGCLLANNQIDTYSLYEDDQINVILDKFPASYGHLLILPKDHYESFDDLPEALLTHIMNVAKTFKPVLMKAFNAPSVILIQNNGALNSLKHYHLHLVPHTDEDLSTLYDASVYQDNSDETLKKIQSKILSYL